MAVSCPHDWDDPTCSCQLQAIIERRENLKGLLWMMGTDPERVEDFKAEYYRNPFVYNLVNLFEQLYRDHKWMKEELDWFCRYTMGDTDCNTTVAGWRAFNTLKRLESGM